MWNSTLWLTLHGVIFKVKLERIHGTVHNDGQVRWGLLVQGRPALIPGTLYWQARTRVDRNLIYFWSHGVKNLWKRLQFQNKNNTSIFFFCISIGWFLIEGSLKPAPVIVCDFFCIIQFFVRKGSKKVHSNRNYKVYCISTKHTPWSCWLDHIFVIKNIFFFFTLHRSASAVAKYDTALNRALASAQIKTVSK